MNPLNLDVIGYPPLDPAAAEAMAVWTRTNPPSPLHPAGQETGEAIAGARTQVASLVGGRSEDIIFTASGSEALNLAVKGLAWASRGASRILVSAVEHSSVMHSARFLERLGFELGVIPVDSNGVIDLSRLESLLEDGGAVVAITAASNEIGTLQPVAHAGDLCARVNAPLVVDAVVAAGKIPMDVSAWKATAVALAGHQLGAPKGAGALWLKPHTRIVPLIHGGIQEEGRRAGTENVPAMVAMGVAAERRRKDLDQGIEDSLRRRSRAFKQALEHAVSGIRFTGHRNRRLPHHLSCTVDVEGEAVLLGLQMEGIIASTGSTCSRAELASHVLKAVGMSTAEAKGSLVFSIADEVTVPQLEAAAGTIGSVIQRLRAMAPPTDRDIVRDL